MVEKKGMLHRFSLFISSVVLICICSVSSGWETDNFSCVTSKLEPVQDILNAETNRRIKKALDDVNTEQLKNSFLCDHQKMTDVLRNAIAPPWTGSLEDWAQKASISKCVPPSDDNIFTNFSFLDSPVAKSAGLMPVIKIAQTKIGVDKLSHFMTEGFDYWQKIKKGGSLKDALAIGIEEEEGGYGWSSTGTKSYGDMSANFHGYLFWSSVFTGERPYLSCVGGTWTQLREFKWEEYVNSSFDESINCNEWKNDRMKFAANAFTTVLLAKTQKLDQTICPIRFQDCMDIAKHLETQPPVVMQTIVHPACLNIIEGKNINLDPIQKGDISESSQKANNSESEKEIIP